MTENQVLIEDLRRQRRGEWFESQNYTEGFEARVKVQRLQKRVGSEGASGLSDGEAQLVERMLYAAWGLLYEVDRVLEGAYVTQDDKPQAKAA